MKRAQANASEPGFTGQSSTGSGRGASETIGFRLGGELFAILADRAALQNLSIHQYARTVVVEAMLQSESIQSVHAEIAGARRESHQLRLDLVFSMKTLFMTAGKMPEQAAKEWVERNFHL